MNSEQLDRQTDEALATVAKNFAPRDAGNQAPSQAMRQASMKELPRAIPRQAPDAPKLTPVEHLEQALENLEKATAMLMGLGETLTGSALAEDPISRGPSSVGGVFNRMHELSGRVDTLSDVIQREISRIRDWV